jgi:hypothetical protein
MKQVIDGLVYNTETAEEIASWSNNLPASDFHHCDETLYKTKNGRFFVAGAGGPLSGWREPEGTNGWRGSSGIRALEKEEALIWCESHEVGASTIEAHFEVEEA